MKKNKLAFSLQIILIIELLQLLVFSSAALAQLKIIQPRQQHNSALAVIVDKVTYQKIGDAVDAYRDAVEDDGLSAFILIDDWKNPEEIKSEIIKLYNGSPKLEGAVFIGDIPIPMIRNAQYMTSAFKLDEDKYPDFRAAVASDCYYDDFNLKFKYLGRDSVHKLSYYYSLLPESPQRIEKEIYSGRIKPSGSNIDKYDAIKKYLLRTAEQKKKQNFIKNAFVFTGHGYHSQSLPAWADERTALREQFPQLFRPDGRLKNLHYSLSDEMKDVLLIELQRPEMDLAIFHAHGDTDMQLLLGYPPAMNVNQNIEWIKSYLRSKLRAAQKRNKSIAETKEYFKKDLDVPESWFNGSFSDSVAAADSMIDYKLDMHIEDVRSISPQPKFIMFDECFNGSYHLDEYIAGEYVFGKGKVIAAEANTVNTLQDRWADEYLGLLNEGIRIGNWHRLKNSLESVIIGDPTFHFTPLSRNNDIELLLTKDCSADELRNLTVNSDPVVRELAVGMLYKKIKAQYEYDLVKIYRNEPSPNVRLRALKCLAEIDGKGFREILKESINDPYEFIRRMTAIWMGETGDKDYLPLLARQIIFDESQRVSFDGKSSIMFFNDKEASDELNKVIDNLPEVALRKELKDQMNSSMQRNETWLYKEILPVIESDTTPVRKRIQEARTFRNYRFHEAVPRLITLMENQSTDLSLRVSIAEALGWFNLSYQKDKILIACNNLIGSRKTPLSLKEEVVRTKNRLIQGLNDALLP